MNDISYDNSISDLALIQKIGNFVKAQRIKLNLTQDEVSQMAVISRSTLSLTERGENISLLNLIKILRVLNALYVLDFFKEETQISPLKLAKEEENKRKRATKTKAKDSKDDLGW